MKPLDPFGLDLGKTTLIEASAGTGKTYTITTLVVRLVALGFPVESILVVTFTEAAAAELKLRIRQRLVDVIGQLNDCEESTSGEKFYADPLIAYLLGLDSPNLVRKLLSHALICFDQASVMTIHSFCLQVLRSHAFESDSQFDTTLVPDSFGFMEQISRDFFMARISSLDWLTLGFMDSIRVTPESFIMNLLSGINLPDIHIVPEAYEFSDVSVPWEKTCHKIRQILEDQSQEIAEMIQSDNGIKKNSYSSKNVSAWIQASLKIFEEYSKDCPFFDMREKGDPLYKFTSQRIVKQTKQGHIPLSHELFDLCQELVSLSKVLDQNLVSLQWEYIKFCQAELEKIKNRDGICFFDDLINDLVKALEGPQKEYLKKAVRFDYKACLIDEFQDTDPGQYKIFSHLFSDHGTPFFMIGDPKQAIYSFRGGDIFTYLLAASDSEQQFTLHRNYRSSGGLVQAVNEIFAFRKNPFLFSGIEFSKIQSAPNEIFTFLKKNQAAFHVSMIGRESFPLDRKGFIKKSDAMDKIPDIVADCIRFDLGNTDLIFTHKDGKNQAPEPSHMAVLVRTNEQAQDMYRALTSLDVPCFVSKTGSVFDAPEARELYEIMLAVTYPEQASRIKAALITSIFGYTLGKMANLDEDPGFMISWQETFFYFHTLWITKGFSTMIMALLHWPKSLGRPGSGISERGITNVFHLVELISAAQQEKGLSMKFLLKWLALQLYESTRESSEDELRLESDKKSVAIVTIHKSKGMEYPIVYLPYLWSNRKISSSGPVLFHDFEKDNHLCLDLSPAKNDCNNRSLELAEKELRAEERRLLYVALTRASLLCRVFWAGVSGVGETPLGQMIHCGNCEADSDMEEDWQTLAKKAHGHLAVERFVSQKIGSYIGNESLSPILCHRKLSRNILKGFSMSSFSSIIEGDKDVLSSWDREIYDPVPKETFSGMPAFLNADNYYDSTKNPTQILLETFPKGAASGNFFHGVFQDLDFCHAQDGIVEIARHHFQAAGFEDKKLLQLACKAVLNVLDTRLETPWGENFCLGEIPLQERLTELEFVFPNKSITSSVLEKALSKNPVCDSYTYRVKNLDYNVLKGFIKGFIDLVFRHNGKWYILDYKSNFLGETYQDYDQYNILQTMEDHDYFLQYHIYLLALHRYLTIRLEGYQYQRDFGGVLYLFIRGMPGKRGINKGVFYDKPSFEVIDYLDRLVF